jgi:NAD(P)-dependent dehydrogenase (short-subunit alcohol dehydrogenase family)
MGIIGFIRRLANDVARDGITANAVLPGLTNTLATAPQSEEQKRTILNSRPSSGCGTRGHYRRDSIFDK